MYIKYVFSAMLAALPPATFGAGITTLNLSLAQKIEAPRWMFDPAAEVKGGALITDLVEGKKALLAKDRPRCLAAFTRAYAAGKSLGAWILYNHLLCAQIRNKDGSVSVEALQHVVERAEAQPRWLLSGPGVTLIRNSFTAALLALAEQQVKTDRRTAWTTLDKLQQVRAWLNAEDRANVYHWAGELAFIEQNLLAAQDFLTRSLSEKDSAEIRRRVESIRSTLLGKSKDVTVVPTAKSEDGGGGGVGEGSEDLGISEDERAIYQRLLAAYQAQDYIPAIEDGMDLLGKYPGSRHANEGADKVLDIYLALANHSEDKFRHVRESAVKSMLKADASHLTRWAGVAYNRGVYRDALGMAEKAYTKLEQQPEGTKVLLLLAKSAIACGEYERAHDVFELLIKRAGGTAEAAEAAFRLGLLDFRLKKYPSAAANFERLLALKLGKDYEYRALYWQWRAHQKIDLAKSATFAEPLVAKYPLSYYGLRAKAELNNNTLELAEENLPVKAELRLLDSERLGWERFTILLRAGWFREAERELDSLPAPVSNEERLIRARYWAAALRYDNAIPLMNKAFDENPDWLRRPLLEIVFPQEYTKYIARESKANGLTPEWVLSVIRQESSFRPEVRSPANAYGVMQLIPSTGLELAREFKLKDYNADQLLKPEINIRLGTVYLSRLARSFSGNLPLSLAAYNAGPTRIKRWIASRKDLGPIESTRSSLPEDEIWMDELPWDETSHYVKSILRNWLIYRMINTAKLGLSEPIWMDAKAAPR